MLFGQKYDFHPQNTSCSYFEIKVSEINYSCNTNVSEEIDSFHNCFKRKYFNEKIYKETQLEVTISCPGHILTRFCLRLLY